MRTIRSIKTIKKAIHQFKMKRQCIGFVPTMGSFHDGHLSLMHKSRRENQITVVSIYVNPTQFDNKSGNFHRYPRNFKCDKSLAIKENVDIIFYPSDVEMYPKGYLTFVKTNTLSNVLCGKSRPGHFSGVATIIAMLLTIIEPDRMYLGSKDAQQVVVLKKMIDDLKFPVRIKTCPTIREKDGLAFSSRNQYLNSAQRQEAPVLYQSLRQAKKRILAGKRNPRSITRDIRNNIVSHSSAKIDYIECVDANTLLPLKQLKGKIMIALAAKLGKARLIDNIIFSIK